MKNEKDDKFLRIEKHHNRHSHKPKLEGPFYPIRELKPHFDKKSFFNSPKEEEIYLLESVLYLEKLEQWEKEESAYNDSVVWAENYIKTEILTEMFEQSVIEKLTSFSWRSNSFYLSIRESLDLPLLKEYKEYYILDQKHTDDIQYESELTEHNEIKFKYKHY